MKKLQEDLHRFKTVERPKVIKDIATARAHGDLSENAEYDAAKEHQGFVEAKIREMDDLVARAEVVDPAKIVSNIVVFGATVTLLDPDTDDEIVYRIVGDIEANPDEGKIGISTPVARAMMGRELDDEVTVRAPGGNHLYEIIDITYKEIV